MEKVRNFVVKYQVWFKIIEIILLLGIIFLPLCQLIFYGENETKSIWYFVSHSSNVNNIDTLNHALHYIFAWIVLILSLVIVLLTILSSFFKKQSINTTTMILQSFNFLFIILTLIWTCIYEHNVWEPNGIPHISFYLSIFNTMVFIFLTIFTLERKGTE